jgi:uncharacterized protein (DUF427 family)
MRVESVWDYPRPPRVEPCGSRVRVVAAGVTVADSERALRVLETSQAPAIYVPPDDVDASLLRPATGRPTLCEWKGRAVYLDVGGAPRAAWSYPVPRPGYEAIRDHLAFYPQRVEACYLGDERVAANGGDFYGGWITADVCGPFKGAPGTTHW